MAKISTILFDFDGVITDTEPQYDIYVEQLAEKYQLGIENFAQKVKGTTTKNILETYFSHFTPEEVKRIDKEVEDFEAQMDFPPVAGAIEFIHYLKTNNYKVGLVTSSQNAKMKVALDKLNLTNIFDTEVTADRITDGKPNPMCYLLAAKDLNVSPAECLVFEDSFHGIQAGTNAGMRVVGVSTTIEAKQLEDKTHSVIADFKDKENLKLFLE